MEMQEVAALLRDYARGLEDDLRSRDPGRLDRTVRTMRLLLDQLDGVTPRPRGVGGRPMTEENQALADAIASVLKDGPMHVADILSELEDRKVEVPGKGDTAVLISLMRRLPNVRRLHRGTYDLVR